MKAGMAIKSTKSKHNDGSMGTIKPPQSKSTSKKNKTIEDVNSLQAEVASFASSLGLASKSPSAENSGFNDVDFRKTGPIKPKKQAMDFNKNHPQKLRDSQKTMTNADSSHTKQLQKNYNSKGRHKQETNKKGNGPLSLAENVPDRQFDGTAKSFPKVPLMKPSSLSSPWYADAAALEAKICQEEGNNAGKLAANFSKSSWEALVQNKLEQAQRLMEQYVSEYERSREKSADMRMVAMTQKSGTSADKVAAITVLVQDNPLANLKALDTILDRKLKYLAQESLHDLPESRDGSSLLLFWYWEDCLKRRFERFVVALEDASKDTLPFLKDKALKVIFLNQILLSSKGDGPKLAKRLVDIYFALFKVLISEDNEAEKNEKNGKGSKDKSKSISEKNKKEDSLTEAPVEIDSRLLSALLTGINRAFPYVSTDEADIIIQKQTPILFQLVHSKSFNIGVQALMLLYQLLAKNQTVSDRFYRALYSTLLTPALMKSSKVSLQQPPQFACACLFILSEVLKARPVLWNAVLQPEDDDEDFEYFVDVDEESEQRSDDRLNTTSHSLTCSQPDNNNNMVEDKDQSDSDMDDSENHVPSPNSGDDNSSEDEDIFGDVGQQIIQPENKAHTNNCFDGLGKKNSWPRPGCYNPRQREPAYCNADRACWWELTALASHVHPSVATMAQTLLLGANIVYNGDPLRDLSLGAFIDRFIEKKPKASKKADGIWHGGSQIAPARKVEIVPHPVGRDLLSLAEEEVPPEDVVFHKFYLAKASSSKRKTKKKKAKELEDEVTGDDIFVEDNVDDDFAGGDESDNEEIDDLIGQDAGLDIQSHSDGEYDYDKLDEVLKLEDETLLADDSEDDAEILEDSLIDDETLGLDIDPEAANAAGKMKGKKRMFSEKSGPSPFASLEDYSHLLNDRQQVTKKAGARHRNRSNKKLTKKDHSNL